MKESTMSEALRAATEGLQNNAVKAASEAERQVRESAPRIMRSAHKSYEDANGYVGELVEKRSLAALLVSCL